MTAAGVLSEICRDRASRAKAWKRAGGSVIGYFADDVPTALVEAAGFLAYRISGDPDGGQPAAMARGPIDVRADRLEFVNSWVHLIAAGRYDFVDHYIVSNSRKYVLQLAERLAALEAAPSVHILDRALGDSPAARDYNHRQVAELKRALESWSGEPIGEPALRDAIARRNAIADLARQIGRRRQAEPPTLSGSDALDLLRALRSDHSAHGIALAAEALAAERDPIAGRRLFVAGSPLDHSRVYREIEQDGFVVVGESHGWGGRLLEQAIGPGEPVTSIAEHYHRCADFIVPLAQSVAAAAARFSESGAGLALHHVFAHDDASLWEAPSEQVAFGAPHFALAEQPYRGDGTAIAQALGRLEREHRL